MRQQVRTILVGEDNEDDLLLFKRAYQGAGFIHELRAVENGEQVINYLQGAGRYKNRTENPLPELLFLDLKMPRKDGFEVIEWVRDTKLPLKVVVLTTSGDLSDVKRAYERGANSFITKSSDLQEFVEQLKEVKRHWL